MTVIKNHNHDIKQQMRNLYRFLHNKKIKCLFLLRGTLARSRLRLEGRGRKAERGKVREGFFQVGGQRAEGGGGRKET